MNRCNCSSQPTVSSTAVSSTSTDPAYFAHLKKKLNKSENILDDSLYYLVQTKVTTSEILEKVEAVRQAGTGLMPENQTDLASLIELVDNCGKTINSIAKISRQLKNRLPDGVVHID